MDATSTTEPFAFAPSAARPAEEDALVRETRREIATLVRETAELARQDIAASHFFRALADHTARAMAAEGAVIWQRHEQGFRPLCRLGRITDLTIDASQWACHQRMLEEVARGGQPVIVPSTPEARDADQPANPSLVPVAVAPLSDGPTSDEPASDEPASDVSGGAAEYLLEVFLEEDGGPTAQRGYLRFAAQMADLGGDFLRLHRIRSNRAAARRWQRLATVTPLLHHSLDASETQVAIVDTAADLFAADRVSLLHVQRTGVRLLAVSHVERIDQRSEEAQTIRGLAATNEPRYRRTEEDDPDDARQTAEVSQPDGTDQSAATLPTEGPEAPQGTGADALDWEAMLPLGPGDAYRLVLQHHHPRFFDRPLRHDLQYFCQHAGRALDNTETVARIPWAGLALDWLPAAVASPRPRRKFMCLAIACVIAIVAVFPVPLVVTAPAELSARQTQYVYAPADGVVRELLVRHGQSVAAGEPLLRIVDRELEDEIESLLGQRAVLVQRAAELSHTLADGTLRERTDRNRVQADQDVVHQQIAALDVQLQLHRQQRQRLTLRSTSPGIVDGWQLERTLSDRPVTAGQPLLSVIRPEAGWEVEAFVPQNRLDHVLRAQAAASDSPVSARLVLDAHPDAPLVAELTGIGPAITLQADAGPAARARFTLQTDQLPPVQTGSPATVAIPCGRRPLLYVAFQDLIRTVRAATAMYL
ncbi:HlyD family efflux transporter periplasmic adaptor subunit [Roseimaritima sediminicola]|uniref:HlyD family efflux transporter periplasmic adaptor subunit n=1 Tax=Roseimaritima sediminicola TaxID=2662066 RepID=UPI0012983C92|nr:HlyD family efflux transporter periplasmic adaptor subunit [Roseimaritima sediminicola]